MTKQDYKNQANLVHQSRELMKHVFEQMKNDKDFRELFPIDKRDYILNHLDMVKTIIGALETKANP